MHGTCKGLCRGPLLPGPILDIYPMCGDRSGPDCLEIPIGGRYYKGKIATNIMVLGKGTRNGSRNDIGHDILADRYDVTPGRATCCKAELQSLCRALRGSHCTALAIPSGTLAPIAMCSVFVRPYPFQRKLLRAPT